MNQSTGENRALTLSQLNQRVLGALAVPTLQNVWVVGELSDVRQSGGHCYMELLEKDSTGGAVVARMRGIIWASSFSRISAAFYAATGQRFATGLKVMARGSVNYHPSYGMSFVINAIDPSYTMGEAERLRREILERLEREGVMGLNKELEWNVPSLRVAVISAEGAAGYGDFMNQLRNNKNRLRFTTRLFPAVMQGERTVASVIAALEEIVVSEDDWDCVVLIRGGGATSELSVFDNYELASNIAQFPLPVIVGIGHERDVTVLDYVANLRVKTPTAAAEFLIKMGDEALEQLRRIGEDVTAAALSRLSGCREQLAYIEGVLPTLPVNALVRARSKAEMLKTELASVAEKRLAPSRMRLDSLKDALEIAGGHRLEMARRRIDAVGQLMHALSPQATLERGYSLVSAGGRVVRSVNDLASGDEFTVNMADGEFKSRRI